MDDITSNINITCDMLIAIVRNLIILTNTSSNISPEAVKALLDDAARSTTTTPTTTAASATAAATNQDATVHSSSSSSPSPQTGSTSLLLDNINQYHYHLYHPLYMNNQLNQYKIGTKGHSTTTTTTTTASSDAADKNKEK
jgi:hypothetical protein